LRGWAGIAGPVVIEMVEIRFGIVRYCPDSMWFWFKKRRKLLNFRHYV